MRAAGFAVLLILIVTPFWHIHIGNRLMPPEKTDLVPVWVGIRAALHRTDPYSDGVAAQIQTIYYGRPLLSSQHVNKQRFAYPLHAALVLAPLGLFPWLVTRNLFWIVMPLLLAASVPLWLRILNLRVTRRRLAICTVLYLVSWPTMWSFRLCQIVLVLAVFAAAGAWLLKTRRDLAAGLVLSLATIKPQLLGPLLLWLAVWSVFHRRWAFLISLISATGALLVGAQLLVPGWVPHWLAVLADYSAYTHIEPMLILFLGPDVGSILMLALAIPGIVAVLRLRHAQADSQAFGVAIALTLALTIALIPTILPQIYNQVLLLPGILILLEPMHRRGYAKLTRWIALFFLAFGFAIVPISVLGETLFGAAFIWDNLPMLNFLFPASVALALITHVLSDTRGALQRSEIATPGSAPPAPISTSDLCANGE